MELDLGTLDLGTYIFEKEVGYGMNEKDRYQGMRYVMREEMR